MIPPKYRGRAKHRDLGPKTKSEPWYLKYLKENPLAAGWTALLTFGATILLIYFIRIDYFPDNDLQSLAATFAALALLTLFLFVVIGAVMVWPSIAIGNYIYDKKENDARRKFVFALGLHLLIPALFWGWFVFLTAPDTGTRALIIFEAMVASAVILMFLARPVGVRWARRPADTRALKWYVVGALKHLEPFLQIIGATCSSALVILALLIGFWRDQPVDWELAVRLVGLFIFLGVWGQVFATAILIRKSYSVAALALVLAALVPLKLFGALSAVPEMTVRMMRVGHFYSQSITISEKGCHVLAARFQVACPEKRPLTICGVHVLSRIGKERYLEMNLREKDSKVNNIVRTILPEASVLGYTIDETNPYLSMNDMKKKVSEDGWVGTCMQPEKTLPATEALPSSNARKSG